MQVFGWRWASFDICIGSEYDRPAWIFVRDYTSWHVYVVEHKPAAWSVARHAATEVTVTCSVPQTPILKIIARLGFVDIGMPVINRLLWCIPCGFLSLKPTSAVETISALLLWELGKDIDLVQCLGTRFAKHHASVPIIKGNCTLPDEVMDADTRRSW